MQESYECTSTHNLDRKATSHSFYNLYYILATTISHCFLFCPVVHLSSLLHTLSLRSKHIPAIHHGQSSNGNRGSHPPLFLGLWNVCHSRYRASAKTTSKQNGIIDWDMFTIHHSSFCGILYCQDPGYECCNWSNITGRHVLTWWLVFKL
jgi:hypothetical protein